MTTKTTGKPLLDTALGLRQSRPPVWIMRQAGRYLPEYRALREKAGGFLELCYTPELATEVTLQPLQRFDLDAAILFSDILVIPHALGQKVWFEQGEGPRLEPLVPERIGRLATEQALDHLAPVLETVERVRSGLSDEKTLIGFCGAPWTVATYMIGGRGSPDQAATRLFALAEPEAFDRLLDILVETSAQYLAAQVRAGADIVQIFESWALNLDDTAFRNYVIGSNRRLAARVRELVPGTPIIGFPRGAAGMLSEYARETGVSVLGLDFSFPPDLAGKLLPQGLAVQGNLDPLRLVAGGRQMEEQAQRIIAAFSDRPHIFNLGHGIVPQTPIAHVERLIEVIKS